MDFKRNVYLETVPLTEAVRKVREALDREKLVFTESVGSHEAAGRVLSAPVYARYSAPTVHSAAMDGYAVRAEDTFMAREGSPLTLALGTQCMPINTGHPLPEGCDAVIMIEHVLTDEGHITIEAPAFPWQHVRRIGEDIVATELLFPRNHVLTPYDVGALLSGGIWDVMVWEQLRVRIIPTGDEVLDFTLKPDPGKGQVVESNSQVLAALARQADCQVERTPPVPDNPEALHAALCDALNSPNHVIIICAGSSAGSKDFTRATLEREGTVLVHGVAAMPGKPSLAALCHDSEGRDKLVIGAPGYPVSSVVCFEELLKPLLAWLSRKAGQRRPRLMVELTRKLPSKLGVEEFVRLSVGKVGEKAVGIPLGRGAGNITTLTRAQAITRIPAAVEGLAEGAMVPAELTVSEDVLENVLVCVGSHDNTLDVLADELMGEANPFRLVSTHVGSMGGITALGNDSCHMAGMHLLDEASGDFNFSFLEKYLPDGDVELINLAIRHQGLIVAKGNPKNITSVADLRKGKRDNAPRFINRQRGAGTRILFDWYLRLEGMNISEVNGYEKEETTHMAVAVNVLTGAADCGMGIYAASQALGLDFVPLARERYDLVIPRKFLGDPRIIAVRRLLESAAFKARIEGLGGYETSLTGQVMQPGIKLG